MPYERTQSVWWPYLILLVPLIAALYVNAWHGYFALAQTVAMLLLLGLALSAFTRLTIHVDATAVTWRFGWGFPSGSIAMGEIDRAETTQTNLLEGFGIHWTIWHGWLWNVGGFQAVEIFKTGGGGVTLGTDDPQGLMEAIERFRRGVA